MSHHRRTATLLSDDPGLDPAVEAGVIMTAAVVGFAAGQLGAGRPVRFDMDPLQGTDPEQFADTVGRIEAVVRSYLVGQPIVPGQQVLAGTTPEFDTGGVIMGVYALAGQQAPPDVRRPVLTPAGKALWSQISTLDPALTQYVGRGAYTGFVDNPNTVGPTEPVGPMSTVRFVVPDDGPLGTPMHPRWCPPDDSPLWSDRTPKEGGARMPWGLIMGSAARRPPVSPNPTGAANLAEQTTREMRDRYGMLFEGSPAVDDVVGYTHGMIQAIYRAYGLGPACTPYEVAVGDHTKKLASCLPCTLFMCAVGYPPTSIHLGRGESWVPLYAARNPGGPPPGTPEHAVVRDLNGAWCDACTEHLKVGIAALRGVDLGDAHDAALDRLDAYLAAHGADRTVAASLILDAVAVHDNEANRIRRTLARVTPAQGA